MKPRHRKLTLIVLAVAALGVAVALVLNAFSNNLVFFFTPTQVANGEAPSSRAFRIGGLVEEGSIRREADGLTLHFIVTDIVRKIPVTYTGLTPALFMEGKGVVAEGRLGADGLFAASRVLARHDENYMAPEAAYAIEQAAKAQKTVVR